MVFICHSTAKTNLDFGTIFSVLISPNLHFFSHNKNKGNPLWLYFCTLQIFIFHSRIWHCLQLCITCSQNNIIVTYTANRNIGNPISWLLLKLSFGVVHGGWDSSAGIVEQSMGARNWVGIGLPFRPTKLHRLADSIPWNRFMGS